jgi:hypothetical protein
VGKAGSDQTHGNESKQIPDEYFDRVLEVSAKHGFSLLQNDGENSAEDWVVSLGHPSVADQQTPDSDSTSQRPSGE